MKFLAVAAAVLAYSFSNWQMSHYRVETRPKLLKQATAELNAAGYTVHVDAFDGMDAELTGAVPEPADRLKAQEIVDAIPGLRALDANNGLKVPGRVELSMEPGSGKLRFSGRLANVATARKLVEFLQGLRQVDAVVTDELSFEEIVVEPSYLESPAFRNLASAFFDLPGNGLLLATESGLHIKGIATAKLEEGWKVAEREIAGLVNPEVMAAARKMSGAIGGDEVDFRLLLEVASYPSEWHVPGRRPDAPLNEVRLGELTGVLSRSEVVFAPSSKDLRPEETGKLEQASRAMRRAGSRVRFVVGGYYQAGDAGGAREILAQNRAQSVAGALAQLGVAPEQMEVATFALGAKGGVLSAPLTQKVEIRVR
jgi:outer membrane protein OmpA-like peptidoglycan-associated protein